METYTPKWKDGWQTKDGIAILDYKERPITLDLSRMPLELPEPVWQSFSYFGTKKRHWETYDEEIQKMITQPLIDEYVKHPKIYRRVIILKRHKKCSQCGCVYQVLNQKCECL